MARDGLQRVIVSGALAAFMFAGRPAAALTLANAPGDGQVAVSVDGYGSFGYEAEGVGTDDALYDPVGPVGSSSTSWESAVYFRKPGSSKFLSTGMIGTVGESGGLANPGFATSSATTATSTFTFAGLEFDLEQHLEEAFAGGARSGSILVQTYTITNPAAKPLSFDLVRYYEGDLFLGGAGVPDGGGHLFLGPTEYVFETDVAGDQTTLTNFVGITAEGGTIPTTGRFEVGQWSNAGGFPGRISADVPLADAVFGDGPDANEFVDPGQDYDVGIALANQFTLGFGERAVYVTTTLFGTGAPGAVEPTGPTTTTTTPTTPATSTTLPPPEEVCGNCRDDDGNGLVDFEDPRCCAAAGALTLTSARVQPSGAKSKLKLRGTLPGTPGTAPPRSSLFLQLRREGGDELLCAMIPAERLVAKKLSLVFKDKGGAVTEALGLQTVALKATRKGPVKLSASGKQVALASPGAGRVRVTVGFGGAGGGRCAQAVEQLRAGKKSQLQFP